ncbi:MAG: hypothetical protein JJU02_12770 [Cryomorphaceae bacterium]|nr:hypothetical protein [Cryomorphaceae bacterium]
MKIDVIQRIGRKKDFWDLHALNSMFTLERMLELHKKRYSYTHDRELIIQNFTNFNQADEDFDPVCLQEKQWAFIKEDFINWVKRSLI